MSEWYETAKRPPTEKDGVGEVLDVLCAGPHIGGGGPVYRAIPWHMVAEFPSSYPLWQRITPPTPPEEKAFQEWWDSLIVMSKPNPRWPCNQPSSSIAKAAFYAGVQWQKEQGK